MNNTESIKQALKTYIGDISEELNSLIISQITKIVLNKLKKLDENITEVPPELDYIIIELSVIRFNMLGSEGMKSESIEGHSISFNDEVYNTFDKDILEWYNGQEYADKGIQFI